MSSFDNIHEPIIYNILLKNTKARIVKYPVHESCNEDTLDELDIKTHIEKLYDEELMSDNTDDISRSSLYISSDNIINYVNDNMENLTDEHINNILENQYVVIIINNLKDLYLRNITRLTDIQITNLNNDIYYRNNIIFINIFDKQPFSLLDDSSSIISINIEKENYPYDLYYLDGDISEFDIINIPLKVFITHYKNNEPIQVELLNNSNIFLNFNN